jgi:MoxR-like ATPase
MNFLRQRPEDEYQNELTALKEQDSRPKPHNWLLSPWAVLRYIMGGKLENGFVISPKYIGNQRLVEIAIATLASDRALLLMGVPGTAKSWLAEHLAAAISGNSTLLIQGTAGLGEENLRYNWNYAQLLAKGPSFEALVESPLMRAMQAGKIARIEEFTRLSSDVQDALISILSEKTLSIPELKEEISAQKGFNVICTANDRDRGVNELSSALKRRFNTVILPLPASIEEEVIIVKTRVAKMAKTLALPAELPPIEEIKRLVTIFKELREGKTIDGKHKLKSPSSTLSSAEAISVINDGLSLAAHFGNGRLTAYDLAAGVNGAVIKDPNRDKKIWTEYLETVVKNREDWKDLYTACRDLL